MTVYVCRRKPFRALDRTGLRDVWPGLAGNHYQRISDLRTSSYVDFSKFEIWDLYGVGFGTGLTP
ncbi:uncharacterized protein FOMMEDRAFT_23097 [Fomitiporia mediterranea MF3/22]|uniref:uncharacterized protein n=1 Tax=Fomitiporia mediterranea (strain MF3/22) TaxID=694068 RepID=UPI000440815C